MGLFGSTSTFDTDVEKATNEMNTSEDWTTIMEICDNVASSKQNAKDCLRSIVKRLNAIDPHIVMQAITLLDACSSNCGKVFHLEIASRDFEAELKKLLGRKEQKIVDKTRVLLKKWAEGDFKNDAQLNLIPSLYNKLKQDGWDFSGTCEDSKSSITSSSLSSSAAAAAAAASREEQDLAKAIQLSLKEKDKGNSSGGKSVSLYPSVTGGLGQGDLSGGILQTEGRKVRALYDFEAAEDNELSFAAGDIIYIMDDSDANWWKGSKGKLEGLFPSNFVTADLSMDPTQLKSLETSSSSSSSKKSVKFSSEVEVKTLKRELEIIEVEINEEKIDQLLHLLHEADPQSDLTDPVELLDLEEQVMAMGPLIDAALEKVDRRHAQLTQLSSDLVDAVNLYRTLQREPHPQPPPPQNSYNYQQKITIPMSNQPVYPYNNQAQIPYNHHQVYPRNYPQGISQQAVDYTGAMTNPQQQQQHYSHPQQQFSTIPGHPATLQGVPGINHPGPVLPTGHIAGVPGGLGPNENLAYPNPGFPIQNLNQGQFGPGTQGPPTQFVPNGQQMK